MGLVDDEVDDAREVRSFLVHRNSSSVVFRLVLGGVCTDCVCALVPWGSIVVGSAESARTSLDEYR